MKKNDNSNTFNTGKLSKTALRLEKMRAEFNDIFKERGYLNVPAEYSTAADYALFQSGHRMRPLLALLGYASIKGHWKDGKIIETAVLIEWFHKTSLVLDDILDMDEYRKGHPTLHRVVGIKKALMNGLVMLCRGYEHLLRRSGDFSHEWMEIFREGLDRCLIGQACDICWDNWNGNLEEYLKIIEGKTASVSKLALQASCFLARGNETQTFALTEFGFHIGKAYQILNDIKNVTGIEDKQGKGKKNDVNLNRPNIMSALGVEQGWAPVDWQNDLERKDSLLKASRDMAEKEFKICLQCLENAQKFFYKEYYDCLVFLISEVKDVWVHIDQDIGLKRPVF